MSNREVVVRGGPPEALELESLAEALRRQRQSRSEGFQENFQEDFHEGSQC